MNVDTAKTTHISLCAGYGGIDIGFERVVPGLRTIAYVEIEAFATANLAAKMETGQMAPAPIWTNLKTFNGKPFRGKVDILSGGYPCQPFSTAGQRKGTEDPRHLWPYIARAVDDVRPEYVFLENVEGHISIGLREVLADLVTLGYRVDNDRGEPTWGIFSAAEVGAPHQRKRVFILGYTEGNNKLRMPNGTLRTWKPNRRSSPSWPARPGQPQHRWEPPRTVVADSRRGASGRREITPGSEQTGEQQFTKTSPTLEDSTRNRRRGRDNGDAPGCGRPLQTEGSCGSRREENRMDNSETIRWQDTGQEQGQPSTARCRVQTPGTATPESPMGRNADGVAGGLVYAQLCRSCDSRVDELRLLGNGVVPAVAARAWVVLTGRINQ